LIVQFENRKIKEIAYLLGFLHTHSFTFDINTQHSTWHVQERIARSSAGVLLVKNQVSDALKKLEHLKREQSGQIKRIEEEIINTVVST